MREVERKGMRKGRWKEWKDSGGREEEKME